MTPAARLRKALMVVALGYLMGGAIGFALFGPMILDGRDSYSAAE